MAKLVLKRAEMLELTITSPAFALALDEADDLKSFRNLFAFPKHVPGDCNSLPEKVTDPLYLCANSLGLMPLQAKKYVVEELDKWANMAVEGHFYGRCPWVRMDEKITPLMASIVGAKPTEVVNMNALTINLHLMMLAFYKPKDERCKIMVEDGLFCSDSHAIRSQIILHGLDPDAILIKVAPRGNEDCLRTEDIIAKIEEHGSKIALVLFSGIQFYTGQFFDIPTITAAGQSVGAVVGWDLAHAVGNVLLRLHEWDVDFACWCTYKYMNSGPGALGGAFVHERHHPDRRAAGLNGLDGWWGQPLDPRFNMGELHQPYIGAQSFQISNPPVLGVVCLLASLEIFEEATMERIVEKQRLLTGYLEALLVDENLKKHITLLTPADVNERGSQLSLKFDSSWPVREVHERLEALGVICDIRDPDVMRIGPAPLYNTFADVLRFVNLLHQTLSSFLENLTREMEATTEIWFYSEGKQELQPQNHILSGDDRQMTVVFNSKDIIENTRIQSTGLQT